MSEHRFTKKQKELMNDCYEGYEKSGDDILIKGIFPTKHSAVTGRSLEAKGWLSIRTTSIGEVYAYLDGQQYAEWCELIEGNL